MLNNLIVDGEDKINFSGSWFKTANYSICYKHIMGILSPYVIIGLMIAISTIFLFLNLRRLEKTTSLLSEDISWLRNRLISDMSHVPRMPSPKGLSDGGAPRSQINTNDVVVTKDEDAMTEDLQREIAEYERQIRELNELQGGSDDPHQDIMKGIANMMNSMPVPNWGMPMGFTVIHSADIPMPEATTLHRGSDKIHEINDSAHEINDSADEINGSAHEINGSINDVADSAHEMHSSAHKIPEPVVKEAVNSLLDDEHSQAQSETHSVNTGLLSPDARLIYDKYTLPQLKDLCKKHALPMKGNKSELATRLSAVAEVNESARKNTLVMKLA